MIIQLSFLLYNYYMSPLVSIQIVMTSGIIKSLSPLYNSRETQKKAAQRKDSPYRSCKCIY